MKLKQKIIRFSLPLFVVGLSVFATVLYQPTASAVYEVGSGQTCKDGSGAKSERVQDGSTTRVRFVCEDNTNTTTPAYSVQSGEKCKDGSNPKQVTVGGSGGRPQIGYQCAGGTADAAQQQQQEQQQTQDDVKATEKATSDYVEACMASGGKTKAQCESSANAITNNCAEDKNPDEVAACVANVTKSDFGKCADNSKPNQFTGKCADGQDPAAPTKSSVSTSGSGGNCGGADTAVIDCGGKSGADAIADLLGQFIRILSVGVGIVAVGGIVVGAIMYSSARDNASQTQKAIEIIRNTVIGIILYIFMVAIINWLVPGGVIV